MSEAPSKDSSIEAKVEVPRGDLGELSEKDFSNAVAQVNVGLHSPHRVGSHAVSLLAILDTIEHIALGDNLQLKLPDPNATPNGDAYYLWPTSNKKNTFHFKDLDSTLNDQNLSYGQINGLAGDFYGTYHPITGDVGEDHLTEEQQTARFLDAWYLLAREPKSVAETQVILGDENTFEQAPYKEWKAYVKDNHLQPSWIFAKKMPSALKETFDWAEATNNRDSNPNYLQLLLTNFDHFGEDAHRAYSIGHTAALNHAIEAGKAKDSNKLKVAYAMNAFADHFLEDSFSAGHLRTPRRLLHGGSETTKFGKFTYPAKDLCSNLMHDEDSALGIKVRNRRKRKSDGKLQPDEWTCYGDAYIHDSHAQRNKAICLEALQASADEVWDAYHNQAMPSHFVALDLVPVIESAFEVHDGYVAPLFRVFNGVLKMRNWTAWKWVSGITFEYELYRKDWSGSNYPAELTSPLTDWTRLYYFSGWWNYPLLLDGASPS